jgi:AAA15 family ATPase/GTPase
MNEPHLNAFGVKNFKSFEGEHWFVLKNITFLIGKNSSGKSSFINAMRISQYDPSDDNFDSDLGLRESWINENTTENDVLISRPLGTNCKLLNNRFHFFNSYVKHRYDAHFYGSVFWKFFNVDDDIQKGNIDILDLLEGEWHQPGPPHDDEENWPENNQFYDSTKKEYLTNESFYEEYLYIKTRIKERNQSLSNLLNYKINSSDERTLWINEKNRIEELKKKDYQINPEQELIDGLNPSVPNFGVNKPAELVLFLIDHIISNYDNEIDQTKISEFYEKLNKRFTKNIQEFSKRILDIDFCEIKNADFNFIQLPILKKLILKLIELDINLTSDLYISTHGTSLRYLFYKYKITDFIYAHKNYIKYKCSLISNKKIDQDTSILDFTQLEHKFVINNDELPFGNEKKVYPFIERLELVNKYLNKFEIGDELIFDKIQNRGKIEIIPFIVKNGKKKEIFTFFGFGVRILIPLLLEVLSNKSSILLIEEPESNLHPALQSKLADFFVEIATKFNKQLVIETHSEYIIRRMQYLVANTHHGKNETLPKIKSENANIYYFNDPSKLEKQSDYTYEINFKNDGGLTKPFGPGFFDVTDDIAYELFMLKNKNFN